MKLYWIVDQLSALFHTHTHAHTHTHTHTQYSIPCKLSIWT